MRVETNFSNNDFFLEICFIASTIHLFKIA
jgi:hypothetical protein